MPNGFEHHCPHCGVPARVEVKKGYNVAAWKKLDILRSLCYTIFVGWEEKFPSHNEVSETRYGNRVVAEFPLRRNSSEMGYGVLGKRRDARPSPKWFQSTTSPPLNPVKRRSREDWMGSWGNLNHATKNLTFGYRFGIMVYVRVREGVRSPINNPPLWAMWVLG